MNGQNKYTANGKLAQQFEARCRFCKDPEDASRGKLIATTVGLNIPVIGEPGKLTQDYMGCLYRHLAKRHQDKLNYGGGIVAEMQAFLVLCAFEHDDPSIQPRLERIRAMLFSLVRKNTIADSMLEHIVAELGLDPDDAQKVNAAMRAIRDACCELGQHAAQIPDEARRVIIPT